MSRISGAEQPSETPAKADSASVHAPRSISCYVANWRPSTRGPGRHERIRTHGIERARRLPPSTRLTSLRARAVDPSARSDVVAVGGATVLLRRNVRLGLTMFAMLGI